MRLKYKQKIAFSFGFIVFIMWYLVKFHGKKLRRKGTVTERQRNMNEFTTQKHEKPKLKYILQWIQPKGEPYSFMKVGQKQFMDKRCPVTSCYVTWNRTYLNDVTEYDAILFYSYLTSHGFERPKRRSTHQKYVFVSTEPPAYNPVYHNRYNNFFNMTWTYKLNSDVFYGYILIRDKAGKKVGPKEVMHWPTLAEMRPIGDEIKQKLGKKRKAAAWVVSNCRTRSKRERVVSKIQKKLEQYNMTVDVYGSCGNKTCNSCWDMLETDYYFYLSFENSINEDYVTEKLLNALQHYTVPIVYGGANYTRFMPDGIYLNARQLSVEELVEKMVDLINDKEQYYDKFRWHNHYTYYYAGNTPETDYYCNFCKKINNETFMNQRSSLKDFNMWWNGWIYGDFTIT